MLRKKYFYTFLANLTVKNDDRVFFDVIEKNNLIVHGAPELSFSFFLTNFGEFT